MYKNNYLEDSRVYLSSPIQYCKNDSWRDSVTDILINEFHINLFDPTQDPSQQYDELKLAQKQNNYDKVTKIAKNFLRKDLSYTNKSDFLIAYIPYNIPTYGVTHEIIVASQNKIPVLLISDMNDISYIPTWFFGLIPVRHMFGNWDQLYKYLDEVDLGYHIDDNKWNLIYQQKSPINY